MAEAATHHCPACAAPLIIPAHLSGRIQCPTCGQPIRLLDVPPIRPATPPPPPPLPAAHHQPAPDPEPEPPAQPDPRGLLFHLARGVCEGLLKALFGGR